MRRWYQEARYRQELSRELNSFDIIHYQTLSGAELPFVRALPLTARVVVSVWGSDLLRTSGTAEYADQSELCERADLITVSSIEMREILLAKYGRHLNTKVRFALLGVSLLDEIDRNRGTRSDFLNALGIVSESIVICVGNNASLLNQHLDVLSEFARLPEEVRVRCVVVIPLSYPDPEPVYLARLEAAYTAAGIRGVMLRGWRSPQEVARLRCATDIMIHVPVSDAFSAAMQECLYAGAVLITGAWLPYSRLRSAKVRFHEVSELAELQRTLLEVIMNLPRERAAAAANLERVHRFAHPRNTVPGWLSVYEEALTKRRGEVQT